MIAVSQIARKMIDFQKESLLSYYDAASAMQHQTASTLDQMLNQAGWIPNEGRKAISAWMDTYQEGQDRFKACVENSFALLDLYFNEAPAAAPAETKMSSAPKAEKVVKAEPQKAAPVASGKAKKVAPAKTWKAAHAKIKKEAAKKVKKTAPVKAEKVAPLDAGKAVHVEPKTAYSPAAQKTIATKKQSRKVMK